MMSTTPCPHCGKYISVEGCEENRLNDLYKTNNTATWAKNQLKILFDMAENHDLPKFYREELKRIINGIYITV